MHEVAAFVQRADRQLGTAVADRGAIRDHLWRNDQQQPYDERRDVENPRKERRRHHRQEQEPARTTRVPMVNGPRCDEGGARSDDTGGDHQRKRICADRTKRCDAEDETRRAPRHGTKPDYLSVKHSPTSTKFDATVRAILLPLDQLVQRA